MFGSQKSWLDATPSKTAFAFGLVLGVGLSALAGFIILLSLFLSGGGLPRAKNTVQPTAVQPSPQPSPSAQPAAAAPTAPAEIKLTAADAAYSKGPQNAKVTVVEYSDFQCPFCSRFEPSVKQMLQEYGNKVRFVYRHFPLDSIHPMARPAAIAATCAAEQGKFWEYHDQLFAKQEQLSETIFTQLARDLKLDSAKFASCLTSTAATAKVDADYQSGLQAGVQGTPSTFVNGIIVSGAQPYAVLKAAIDNALK